MRKTKKQLLGLVCLAAVALMTAFAISLPAPDAAAEEEPATGANNTQVQVTVFSDAASSGYIQSPRSGETVTNYKVPVTLMYTRANKIVVDYNYCGQTGQKTIDIDAEHFEAGIETFELDLGRYSYLDQEDNTYACKVTMTATFYGNNGTTNVDSVTFNYRAMSAWLGKTNPENGNPTVEMQVDDSVSNISISVYNKKGDPLFVNKDGEGVPLVIKRADVDPETGEVEVVLPNGEVTTAYVDLKNNELISIELPFEEFHASEGPYTIVLVASREDGEIVSINQLPFDYKPVTPDLPAAGSIFGDLNISRADYLVTGLIAFSVVAGFAMLLIFRRNHRN